MANVVFLADTTSVVFSKALQDVASPVDSIALGTHKPLADNFSVSDAAIRAVSLAKSDLVQTNDTTSFSFAASRTDSVAVLDSAALEPFKALADPVIAASAGSLLSQDYCEAFYFAEDYVGTSRTFT